MAAKARTRARAVHVVHGKAVLKGNAAVRRNGSLVVNAVAVIDVVGWRWNSRVNGYGLWLVGHVGGRVGLVERLLCLFVLLLREEWHAGEEV